MGSAERPQITFALAAQAAGITQKQLRNWLDKAQVALEGDDERSEGQWRRFSLIDVVRLGIVGAIGSYGIPIPQAAEILGSRAKERAPTDKQNLQFQNDSIDERLRDYAKHITLPRRAVEVALRGAVLVISTDLREPYQVASTEFAVTASDLRLWRCRFGFDPSANPANSGKTNYRPAPMPDTSDLRHFIQIDVGQITGNVIARLDETDSDD